MVLTRRALMLAATAGWLRAGASRAQAPDSGAVATLGTLPGKQPLIQHAFRPPNFETPLAGLAAPFTRNDVFFVRYHLAVIPHLDTDSWRLQVGGASARHPLTLTLRELQRDFPHVQLAAVNQCSGNRRGLFSPRVPGVQWGDGAMGNALWTGVRLRDVLRRVGVADDALEVAFN